MEKVVTLCMVIVCLYLNAVNPAPLWPLIDEYEQELPEALDFSHIFESKLDKINRYRHLKKLLSSTIIEIDRFEERVVDEILELEEEMPALKEIKMSPTNPARYLQPRTFVSRPVKNNNPQPDIIPLKKRKNLSVDLTLQTLKDMIDTEEGRARKESNVNYSASRLMRAGRK